ncbi:MAG TPA: hypothetical protein VF484_01870 [Candidatus Limnocylindrales bacterium]
MRRGLFGIVGGVVLALSLAGVSLADSCANVSRAPAACGWTCTAPVIEGNWVWLPSVGADVAAWGFAPPGGPESVANGFPGSNGNYTNGFMESLLGHSAYCLKGVNQAKSHGIVSGCE